MEWNKNLVRLADFAKERNVDRNLVTQYVRYHPEIFEGHITEYKRSLYGDDIALKALDEKYPLPKPVEVIKDPEADNLRRQVIALQEQLLASQKQVIALTEKAVQAESVQALLADKELQLEGQIEALLADKALQLEGQIDRVAGLEKELEASKNELMMTAAEKQKADFLLEQATKQLSDEMYKRKEAEHKLEDVKSLNWFQRLFWKG